MADIGEPLRRVKVIPTRHPAPGDEPQQRPAPQRREVPAQPQPERVDG